MVVSGEQGVVQYDLVKDSGEFQEARHPPRPPSDKLIHAYALLEAEIQLGEKPWIGPLKRTPDKMRNSRPSEDHDILADTSDPRKAVEHPMDTTRQPDEPKIFSGTIGAANKLLKNAALRDQLRNQYSIRAIEMEASGISDAAHFLDANYFVIRGTCDYCDANKNDDWQLYAATIAGAFCRALLENTPQFRRSV